MCSVPARSQVAEVDDVILLPVNISRRSPVRDMAITRPKYGSACVRNFTVISGRARATTSHFRVHEPESMEAYDDHAPRTHARRQTHCLFFIILRFYAEREKFYPLLARKANPGLNRQRTIYAH